MFDVVALGELLIDFTPVKVTVAGDSGPDFVVPCFAQHPGGAPANVLVGLSKMGCRTSFIGKVGDDQFGHFLRDTLLAHEVDTTSLLLDKSVNTTLAFVHLDEQGDRSFSFYRRPGADMMLRDADVNYEVIGQARLFHFGSVSLTDDPVRSATLKAAEYARNQGVLVSYDPNLRPLLWSSLEEAKAYILQAMALADITKISEEELEFLTGSRDFEAASDALVEAYGLKLLLITLGSNGCFYRMGAETGTVPGFVVDTVDTTAAGDAFFGGFLASLLDRLSTENLKVRDLNGADVARMVRFANAVGAITTTSKGAISAIPSRERVESFLREAGKHGIDTP